MFILFFTCVVVFFPLSTVGLTHISDNDLASPPGKSAQLKIIFFLFLNQTYGVVTQKNSLNEIVLLSIQNTCLN